MNKSEMYYESDTDTNVSDGTYSSDPESDTPVKIVTRAKIDKKTGNVIKTDKTVRVVKMKKTASKEVSGKPDQSGIKETVKNIRTIESESEHTKVKLAKKKIADRETELKRRQLPDVPASKAFRPSDIQRIVQHTSTSIFDKEDCALWTGYITNLQNKRKGTYVNFYFRNKKKVALHRLLYANFKGEIGANEYIKYSCSNKGRCCNVNHMVKFEYNSAVDDIDDCDIDDCDIDDNAKKATKAKAESKTDGNAVSKSGDKIETKSKRKNKKNPPKKLGKEDFMISIY